MSGVLKVKRLRGAVVAWLMLMLVGATAAMAMRVSPMVIEMESRGSDATARIEVQNINRSNLAFETRVYRMSLDENDRIVETPADDKFLVFPPQGVLPAGGRQVVRLQWVGDPNPETSEAYYVSISQLPVALAPSTTEAATAQVQILYNMRALVVVAPPGATPRVEAASVRPATYTPPALPGATSAPSPVNGLEVTLRNTGRRHAMMSGFKWSFEGVGRNGQRLRVEVSPEELNQAIGTGYVPARGQRTFRLPIPDFGSQPIRLSFSQ